MVWTKEYTRKWLIKNKERARAKIRQWYFEHADAAYRKKQYEKHKQWRAKHREQVNLISRNGRARNLEKARKRNREYMQKRREAYSEKERRRETQKSICCMREWRKTHKEEHNARNRAWNAAHLEQARESRRKWVRNNPEKAHNIVMNNTHRRRQKVSDAAEHIPISALKKAAKFCPYCGQEFTPEIKKHLDHIWPLSTGGPHVLWNVIVCCAACNLTKNDKLPLAWALRC